MINSLLKDSHSTRSYRLQNSMQNSTVRSGSLKLSESASVNKHNNIASKNPAEVSFRGVSDIKMAADPIYKELAAKAKKLLGDKATAKNLKKFMGDLVETSNGTKKDADINLKSFVEENKANITKIIDKSKNLLSKDELAKKTITPEVLEKNTKITLENAVKQMEVLESKNGIYKSSTFKKFLEFAKEFQILFGAGFALILTGLLRPATIMALPSDKKNIDDKKYASSHSISSGSFGFGLALLMAPLPMAVKKVLADPKAYNVVKNADKLKNDPQFAKAANNYLSQLPDIMLAAPKAMITTALLPIVLKYVFGLEKNKKTDNKIKQPIDKNTTTVTISNEKQQPKSVAFKGRGPSNFFKPLKVLNQKINQGYQTLSQPIAKAMGRLLDTDAATNFIEGTVKHEKFNDRLISHLNAFGSAVLSGFYIGRTLNNQKLDGEKKKTLAINQAAVWATSTIMCYTTDGLINTKINRFVEKFKIINKADNKLISYVDGIKAAKSIMVFGLIYRYISPVLVTPIANMISNRLHDKRQAELAVKPKVA